MWCGVEGKDKVRKDTDFHRRRDHATVFDLLLFKYGNAFPKISFVTVSFLFYINSVFFISPKEYYANP